MTAPNHLRVSETVVTYLTSFIAASERNLKNLEPDWGEGRDSAEKSRAPRLVAS